MRGKSKFQALLLGAMVVFFTSATTAQTCVQPPANLIGWWPGDGNTNDIVGGRNAILHGNATFGPALVGEGFLLDGDGDFVEVPHDPALNVGTGDFTVDLWVNFNTTDDEQVLAEKYVEQFDPTIDTGWTFTKQQDNHLSFGGAGSDPLSIPTNTWIHFAARRKGTVQTIFMNGTVIATGQVDRDNGNSDSSLKFGHRGSPDDTPGSTDTRGFFLNGRIDEMEFFVGRALSDTEIQAIFNAGSAGKCKGVPFKALTADVTIKLESEPNQETFKLISKFVPGPESDGIDPANETVSIQIGAFSITLPAGSFRPLGANFSFDGVIAGVRLQVKIIQLNSHGWRLTAKGGHANLSGTAIPVKVGISLGDDTGSITLKHTLLMAGSHPIKMDTDDKAELP
jgi:Concanavalin A-like lectin/glucanases superfamily